MRLLRYLLVVALLISALGFTATGATAKPNPKKCQLGLSAGLAWDQSDPAYLQVAATTSWKNCSKRIKTVNSEIRVIDAVGGLYRTVRLGGFTADIVRKGSGKETYVKSRYILGTMFWKYFPDVKTDLTRGDAYQTCTRATSGKDAPSELNEWTFYMAVTAYDKSGKKVAELFTPKVQCGTNG